jgi:membrane-bound metal-dependent hydrolase YbcI (DUF457 family)
MFAAHFAAGLALKGRAPRAPLSALIMGAFVLDGLWIVLSVLRIDRTDYDDWSHSLVMSLLWASLFSLLFWRLGRKAMTVLWLAVFSHFILDLVVQGGSVCPPGLLSVGPLVVTHYRLLQLGICAVLLSVYVVDARRQSITWPRVLATCAIVLALNGRFVLGV